MNFDVSAQLDDVPLLFQLLCEDADLRGTRLVTVELLALLYQYSDFILRFLPERGKLTPVLDFVLEDEFCLLNPLIQLADILPHGIAGVPGFLPQRPHFI